MSLGIPDTFLSFLTYIVLFVGVLLAFEGLRALASRGESLSETKNRRMRMIQRGAQTEEVLSVLRDPAFRARGPVSPIARLRRLLLQSGVVINPWLFVLGSVCTGVLGFLLAEYYLPVSDYTGLGGGMAGLAVPYLLLLSRKAERAQKLTQQLPDALDLMARGLRVGHPLAATVGSVASDMADPIGSEFGVIQDQVSYGSEIHTAFREFADRIGTEDANYLAVSVGIQHGTGGNLARVLDILSKVIRDRQNMRKKIKAISSEGRLSGVILTFLPVGIFLSIHTTTPSFYGDVADDPMFKPVVFSIIGLIVLQGFLLYKLVSFKF